MGRRVKPPKGKAGTKRALARKSPKNEGAKVRDLEKRLAEALEQQAGRREILRVISRAQADIQPVFDAIVRSAVTLCHAAFGGLHRVDGELNTLAALYNM